MVGRQRAKTLHTLVAVALFVGIFVSAQANQAAGKDNVKCKDENGVATWTLIPSENDPFGRVLGSSTGSLKAAISEYITSLSADPDGTLHATSVHVWVFGPTDILIADGEATITPIPGEPIGTVDEQLTLTIVGGTGDYEDATGTIDVTGVGYNIFGPASGPGKGFFEISYTGTVCH